MVAVTLTAPGPVESSCTCAEPLAPRLTVWAGWIPAAVVEDGLRRSAVSSTSVNGAPVIVIVRPVPEQVCSRGRHPR